MSCYMVTGEFFADEMIDVPQLAFRMFQDTPSNPERCMCTSREFSRRNEGAGIEKQPFTLRIICRSQEALNAAWEIQERVQREFGSLRMGRLAQREMFRDLKNICNCHPKSPTRSTPPPHPTPVRTFSQASSSGSSARSTTAEIPVEASKKSKKSVKFSPSGAKAPAGKRRKPLQATFEPDLLAVTLSRLPKADLRSIVNDEIAKIVQDSIEDPYLENSRGRIFWIDSPSNPEFLLVGFTLTESPEHVHSGVKKCLKDARLVAYTSLIPNVQQIMHLVTAELAPCARDLHCTPCGTRHNSWYEIRTEAAERIVLNWATWMVGAPYERMSGQLERKWKERTKYSKLTELESTSMADHHDADTMTWAWWTGLSQLDSPRDPSPLPSVEVRRFVS